MEELQALVRAHPFWKNQLRTNLGETYASKWKGKRLLRTQSPRSIFSGSTVHLGVCKSNELAAMGTAVSAEKAPRHF